MLKSLLFLISITLSTFALSQSATPSDFAKDYEYANAKLSPEGNRLGVIIKAEGARRLIVFSMPEFTVVGGANFGSSGEVGDFIWANNDRIVIEMWQRKGWLEQGLNYGELFAVDYNGKNNEMIYGFNAGQVQTGSNLKKREATRGWAEILNTLEGDEDHILISSTRMSESGGSRPSVHKLNVNNGKLSRKITVAPVPYTDFITTKEGELAFAVGTDANFDSKSFRYENDEWVELVNVVGNAFRPLALNDAGDQLLFIDNFQADKKGLYSLNLLNGERTLVYNDKTVDVGSVSFTSDKTSAYALKVNDGYPTYVMFNDTGDEAKQFKSFLATFPGYNVSILSRSTDRTKSVLYVSNDIDPGSFYLFDATANKLNFLFANLNKLSVDNMAQSTPITFPSFDGTDTYGYITYPMGMTEAQKVPLVTLVHGGPHGVRDYWTFDREVQMLAAQGYAVLRVNYRGSGGYGGHYTATGYKKWGSDIQQDIISGTQWAIEQGKIDTNKVCIMGASFGGYSAVMSATLAPDLFKCVVANAGVYDLKMMHDDGDIPDLLYGRSYLDLAIGNDIEQLKQFSPVNNVEKLKASVFIAHGKKDKRVPYAHAKALKKALDKHDKDYEWFVKSTESHGFFDEKNRSEYYVELSEFLEKHLK